MSGIGSRRVWACLPGSTMASTARRVTWHTGLYESLFALHLPLSTDPARHRDRLRVGKGHLVRNLPFTLFYSFFFVFASGLLSNVVNI